MISELHDAIQEVKSESAGLTSDVMIQRERPLTPEEEAFELREYEKWQTGLADRREEKNG